MNGMTWQLAVEVAVLATIGGFFWAVGTMLYARITRPRP